MGATSSVNWKHRPERGSLFLLRLMSRISLCLGRGLARLFLYPIVLYFLLSAPASRSSSRAYLQRVLDRPVRWSDIYRHFHCFAEAVLDRVYLLNQRFDLFELEVEGEALIQQAIRGRQGVFLVGAHIGSFEMLRAFGRQQSGLRVAMAMYEENARKTIAAFSAISPAAQQDVIALGRLDSMLQVSECLEQGRLVGMLADRTLGGDSLQQVKLLDGIATLPVGPFRMAAILRRPVIFMAGLYMGGNRYRIIFEQLADFSEVASGGRQAAVEQAVTRYAGMLERCCRAAPYNWFNFFDFWQADSVGEGK